MSMQAYQPTHVVPSPGLQAWGTPDAAVAPVDTLPAGLDVQLVQRWGGWAQVQCSNGWTCWVDGNVLQPITPAAPTLSGYAAPSAATPTTATSTIASPFAILAGAVVALSTFLPWFSFSGVDLNAFHIPIDFLWSIEAASSEDVQINSLGGIVLSLGVVIAVLSISRLATWRRVAGAAAGLIGLVYAIQLQRSLNDSPAAPGLFSVLGFGVYVTIVGAALAIADFGRR